MATYFTADLHIHHKMIVDYCDRPFRTLDGQLDVMSMNKTLIDNWNRTVKPEDTVYVLGDFGFGSVSVLRNVVKLLDGHKILIRGNHDRSRQACLSMGFDEVYSDCCVTVDGVRLHMRHKPLDTFMPGVDADLHLCGHAHNNWKHKGKYIINVGVDQWGFTPRTLAELMAS